MMLFNAVYQFTTSILLKYRREKPGLWASGHSRYWRPSPPESLATQHTDVARCRNYSKRFLAPNCLGARHSNRATCPWHLSRGMGCKRGSNVFWAHHFRLSQMPMEDGNSKVFWNVDNVGSLFRSNVSGMLILQTSTCPTQAEFHAFHVVARKFRLRFAELRLRHLRFSCGDINVPSKGANLHDEHR